MRGARVLLSALLLAAALPAGAQSVRAPRAPSGLSLPTGAPAGATFVRRLESGAELHLVPVGALRAPVYVDLETQAAARALEPGKSLSVFGSQALEMLRPDGAAASGRLAAASDVDVLGSPDERIARAYAGRTDFVGRSVFGRELASAFTFTRLAPSFTHQPDGSIRVNWDNAAGSERQIEAAYRDWLSGTVRYASVGAMRPEFAAQALLYLERYPGTALEKRTQKKTALALRRWQTAHVDHIGRKISFLPDGGLGRFRKVFAHAADPQSVIDRLADWGVLRGAVGAQILEEMKAAGRDARVPPRALRVPPPATLAERAAFAALAGALGAHLGPFAPIAEDWAGGRQAALEAFEERAGAGPFTIFVDGGLWASGKSTFARDLERAFVERLGEGAVVRAEEDAYLSNPEGERELFARVERERPAVFIYARSALQGDRSAPPERAADYVVYVRATETARLWQFIKRQAGAFRAAPWFEPEEPGRPYVPPQFRRKLVETRPDIILAAAEMIVRSALAAPVRAARYALRLLRAPPDLVVRNSLLGQRAPENRF